MKTLLKAFIGVSIVIIFGLLLMEFLCRAEVKCNRCTKTSDSRQFSIKNRFYLGDYEPLKKTIELKFHSEKIEFKNAWAEGQWYYNSGICLFTKMEKRDGYNVIFEFSKSNANTFLFSLSPIINGVLDGTNGGIMESKKEIRILNLP